MIDVTKFWTPSTDTTNALIARAEKINTLATSKNVTVSRWVNNSKGRQIVTYMVHTGERNQFASKQENVQFTVSVDAGRGNRVSAEQETGMMAQVAEYLNSIVTEETASYELTADGLDGIATAADFAYIAAQFETEQFTVEIIERNNELRAYATRRDGDFDDCDTTPSAQRDWRKITNDEFYIVVGRV